MSAPYWGQLPEPSVARYGSRYSHHYPPPLDYQQPEHRQPDHGQPDHRQPDHRQLDHRLPVDAPPPRRKSTRQSALGPDQGLRSSVHDVDQGQRRAAVQQVLSANPAFATHQDPSASPPPPPARHAARALPVQFRDPYVDDSPRAYQGDVETLQHHGYTHDAPAPPSQRPVHDLAARRHGPAFSQDTAAQPAPPLTASFERRKMFANDRSPLQKLELTLDSLTKEEKRARVEAAEKRARQRAAMRAGESLAQHVSVPDRQPSNVHDIDEKVPQPPAAPATVTIAAPPPTREAVAAQAQSTPPSWLPSQDSINSYHASVPQSTSSAQVPTLAGPGPGMPQRNLSFRERAAQKETNLPAEKGDLALPAASDEAVPVARRDSNKLRNEPPLGARYHESKGPGTVSAPDRPTARMLQEYASQAAPLSARNKELPPIPPPSPDAGNRRMPGGGGNPPAWGQVQSMRRHAAEPVYSRDRESSGDSFGVDEGSQIASPAEAVEAQAGAQPAAAAPPDSRHRRGDSYLPDNLHHQDGTRPPHRDVRDLRPATGLHQPPEWMDEWKKGTTGTLSGTLLDLRHEQPPATDKGKAWWEDGGRGVGDGRAHPQRRAEAFDGEYDDTHATTRFKPPLYLKCGPLLRYCGIRRERIPVRTARGDGDMAERETWRGSIMIVTDDSESSYEIAPMLRLFVQDVALLPPPPEQVNGELAAEYVDPIAGHPKLGRRGETLYVRPVEHIEEARDVSRDETDHGLFAATRSRPDGVPAGDAADLPGSFTSRLKAANADGEKMQKYKDVRGFRLHGERGCTFWRFNVEVELRDRQQRIAYRINRGPCMGFWVPARARAMNIMFYSGNGFDVDARPDELSGPDPMWRDVLNTHQTRPFHVMIGGGNQIFNDSLPYECDLLADWLETKGAPEEEGIQFTAEVQDELESFYLERYCMWFSQGLYGLATSQIPMVNMYDDHDILDGYASHPHRDMNGPLLSGLGSVAFKYYMLFQHQSLITETEMAEPSWILGLDPGPYIRELSRSLYLSLGGKVALLAIDCRTERTDSKVLMDKSWEKIMNRLYAEIRRGQIEHLLVLSALPLAYPRSEWLGSLVGSKLMSPIKALGRAGILGRALNGGAHEGASDHWVAKNHKHERSIIIEDLQDLAIDKSMRITILSGNVNMAAVGQFYSNPKLGLAKHRDPRYMPNVVSSAMANTPSPVSVADGLGKRNKVHHFDKQTDESMIPLFQEGVDGRRPGNKHLLAHRNWCSISQWEPGSTPPPTPPVSARDGDQSPPPGPVGGLLRRLSSRRRAEPSRPDGARESLRGSRPPVSGRMGLLRSLSRRNWADGQRPDMPSRSMSLGRGEAETRAHPGHGRHTSESRLDQGRGHGQRAGNDFEANASSRAAAGAAHDEYTVGDDSHFTSQPPRRAHTAGSAGDGPAMPSFHRTPTGLSTKQMRQADKFRVDLEEGLDIRLNVEMHEQDPAGITTQYRMLVPRLQYEYDPAEDDLAQKSRGTEKSGLGRLFSIRKRDKYADDDDDDDDEDDDDVTSDEE